MFRGNLIDEGWAVMGGLLPLERERWAWFAGDNIFFNGIWYVLWFSCPRRGMHERHGKWSSVYVRFRHWAEQDAWDAML